MSKSKWKDNALSNGNLIIKDFRVDSLDSLANSSNQSESPSEESHDSDSGAETRSFAVKCEVYATQNSCGSIRSWTKSEGSSKDGNSELSYEYVSNECADKKKKMETIPEESSEPKVSVKEILARFENLKEKKDCKDCNNNSSNSINSGNSSSSSSSNNSVVNGITANGETSNTSGTSKEVKHLIIFCATTNHFTDCCLHANRRFLIQHMHPSLCRCCKSNVTRLKLLIVIIVTFIVSLMELSYGIIASMNIYGWHAKYLKCINQCQMGVMHR